jgi:hypothetical protein
MSIFLSPRSYISLVSGAISYEINESISVIYDL